MPHPEKRDPEQIRRQLLPWLARRLPQAKALELRDLRSPSDTGFSSDTLLFELHWEQAGEKHQRRLVARIQPRGFNVFPSYDLTIQYRVMEALAGSDVPVPRVLWNDWSGRVIGAPFYVMERMEGWVPADVPPMHTAGKVAEELGPEERALLWWNGLEAMARIHRLDPFALGLGFLDAPERGDTPLLQQLTDYDQFFSWGTGNRGRYPLIECSLTWLRENAPGEEPTRLCWGDSRLANQIFSGLQCVGVLDWEMVRLGNPVQDLAWWISADRCFSDGLGVERLEGFPDRAATVARWEEMTALPAEPLDYYEVLALMRFAVIMARIGLQMKHYGLAPDDSALDVENLASLTLQRKLEELGACGAPPTRR